MDLQLDLFHSTVREDYRYDTANDRCKKLHFANVAHPAQPTYTLDADKVYL